MRIHDKCWLMPHSQLSMLPTDSDTCVHQLIHTCANQQICNIHIANYIWIEHVLWTNNKTKYLQQSQVKNSCPKCQCGVVRIMYYEYMSTNNFSTDCLFLCQVFWERLPHLIMFEHLAKMIAPRFWLPYLFQANCNLALLMIFHELNFLH